MCYTNQTTEQKAKSSSQFRIKSDQKKNTGTHQAVQYINLTLALTRQIVR